MTEHEAENFCNKHVTVRFLTFIFNDQFASKIVCILKSVTVFKSFREKFNNLSIAELTEVYCSVEFLWLIFSYLYRKK